MMIRIIKISAFIVIFMVTAALGAYFSIHLLIRNEKTVITPDVEGKEIVYVLELLTDLKLNTKVKGSQFDEFVPRHHVIHQDPEPGTEIKQGRDVRLILSKGPYNVVIPNLKGLNVAQARILLNENGLQVGHVSHMYNDGRPEEEVLGQYPAPMYQGFREDRVDLLVSNGSSKTWYRMMPLQGMTLNEAVAAIERHRLVLSTVHYSDNSSVADRTVIDQNPPQGYPITVETPIEVTIAWRAESSETAGRETPALYRYRAPEGFLKQSVRARVNWPEMSLDIFNDYIGPSDEIWILVPMTASATLFLYTDEQLTATEHYGRR